jgi:hypothetical protein
MFGRIILIVLSGLAAGTAAYMTLSIREEWKKAPGKPWAVEVGIGCALVEAALAILLFVVAVTAPI